MVAINPPTTEVIRNDYTNPSFEDTTTSPLINSSWGAEGNCSIQIPPGSTYALPELLGGKALQIIPRNAGQNLLRRGELVAKNLVFDGANPPNGENSIVVWNGTPNASTFTLYSATKITARTAEQPVRTVTPGNYYLGEGQWDLLTITGNSYTGPPFSGATPPFEYKNQLVTPSWVGTPHKSASRLSILSVPPWTPTSNWDAAKNRRYRFGVDRGMLYLDGVGVPWSGLIRVDRAAPENKGGRRYIDGRVFDVPKAPSDFGASLEAFIYPDEFAQCIGEVRDPSGLTYYDQPSRPFDLCYRTREGDGISQDKHYRLHFAYGIHAIEDGESYGTSSSTIDPSTFKWQLIGIPVTVPGHRHSSYFTISTRDVNRAKIEALEMVLYGANGSTPALPTHAEILSYLKS